MQILEVETNDCNNATFFTDYNTGELLYLNTAMEKKFQIFEDYTGKLASDVIPFYDEVCGFENKADLKEWEYFESTFLSEMLNANLRSKTMLWNLNGRMIIKTKYFLAPTSEKRLEAEILFERAIARCLEILSDTTVTYPINLLLELLGEFYSCDYVFVCSFNEDNTALKDTYYWTTNKDFKGIPQSNHISIEAFHSWFSTFENKSILNLDKGSFEYEALSIEDKILSEHNVSNITFEKLWDKDGCIKGVLGLANRSEQMYDERLLQAIAHFVMEQFSQVSMVAALEDLQDLDILTGFYNREKYTEKLIQLAENPPKTLGVLFINLNGLRTTNEYLGYDIGDAQLKSTSSTLTEYFYGYFYRITGDEFVGFIPNCEKDVFEETVSSLQDRLKLQHNEAAFSLGHSWEQGNYSIHDMIKIADTVMVINKQSFYADSLKNTEKITNTMLQDLFRAIAEEEFLVYLQPQIDLKTEQIIGAEALIRRFDKEKDKMIYPDQFIPVYEKKSVIRHVDLYVLRKVCLMLKSWEPHTQEIAISVNLSRVTLMEHGIVKTITGIIDEYQVPHHLIIIEITERIGLIENDVASTLVEEFKSNGFKLSLDDFGCAYSNIVTLAQIEVDEVKIDKSLVDNLISNPKNRVIVKNMLLMCNELENTHTLAEGIETKEQAEFLRSVNCQLGQGYLYAKPMPNEEFYTKYVLGGDTMNG